MKIFKIIGRKYNEEKMYYDWDKKKKFYYYEKIEEKELCTFTFIDLHHAELFLLANYPEYYFGASIIGVDNTDFSMVAVPEFYEQTYEMHCGRNDRKFIIEKEMENVLKKIKAC